VHPFTSHKIPLRVDYSCNIPQWQDTDMAQETKQGNATASHKQALSCYSSLHPLEILLALPAGACALYRMFSL
jgi:hypothetical protein